MSKHGKTVLHEFNGESSTHDAKYFMYYQEPYYWYTTWKSELARWRCTLSIFLLPFPPHVHFPSTAGARGAVRHGSSRPQALG